MLKSIKLSLVKRRIANSNNFSSGELKLPITSGVLLLDSVHIRSLPVLLRLKKELNLKDLNFKVILYKMKGEDFPEFDGLIFVEDDISFLGKLNNKELLDFTKNHVDLLITFAEENHVPINLLTTNLAACLKLGNDPNSEKILDVVIRSGDDAEVFTSEILKFLNQFKNT
ncbi:DUF6913 domain-containing protein [Gillisia marina]|uniref:DUF6913 domain-containing protein n=1 Tax=Gillisia marina TaxID=1167637 RepID=UPI00029A4A9A|nr:hypothetical protein [Gillisia marina]